MLEGVNNKKHSIVYKLTQKKIRLHTAIIKIRERREVTPIFIENMHTLFLNPKNESSVVLKQTVSLR